MYSLFVGMSDYFSIFALYKKRNLLSQRYKNIINILNI